MPKATHLILPAGRSSIGQPESWPLPSEAARILGHVAASSIPILCLGAEGTAFSRIVAGVHRASGRRHVRRLDLKREGAASLLDLPRGRASSYLTLALDGLEALGGDDQSSLASYLDEATPRLVSASRAPLEELEARWDGGLLLSLATVLVHTPALRDRPHEIAALATQRLSMLARELNVRAPSLHPSAAEALAAHEWPGDVTELDAVLLGSLLHEHAPDPIEATHLAWRRSPVSGRPTADDTSRSAEPARSAPPPADTPVEPPPAPTPSDPDLGTLESVAVELAHQLKNPLVTVKTFVTNAPRMEDEEMGRFQDIALEGIDRIDGPLEQLLDFSRLTPSTKESVDVGQELAQCLRTVEPALDAKSVNVDRTATAGPVVRGSHGNLSFALSTLCHHVTDTIEPHSVLSFSCPSPELLRLHYRESGAATHLRAATGSPDSSFPLALLLVRGALTRMGGGLRTSQAQNEVTIELSFTLA